MEEIIMAEDTVKKAATAKKKVAETSAAQDPFEMVEVFIPRDKQHMQPVHVVVNTYEADIPRETWYSVPYYVAKHIEEMRAQDSNTLLLTQALVRRFNDKVQANAGA
jgi:hypothetical protein